MTEVSKDLPHLVYSDCNFKAGSRPRIVHLVEAFEKIGGPPVLVRQIIKGSLAERYEFHVVSYAISGISFRSLFKLKSILDELKPDIVHVHGLKPDGFHAVFAAKISGVKKIITVIHSSTALSVSQYVSAPAKIRRLLVCNILETLTLFLSDSVYTVCDHIRDSASIRFFAGRRLKSAIHNCMNIPVVCSTKSEIKKNMGFNENDILILFIGRICADKGMMVLADTMDRICGKVGYENVKLVLVGVGYGTEYKKIRERFYQLERKNRVIFLGVRNDVFSLNKMADVFVLPSVFKENFSFSLLEAAASGIPVVATDHGGNPELIINNERGILVKPGDAEELAEAVLRLICNKSFREKIGIAGQDRVRLEFSVDKMLEKTDGLYQSLLNDSQLVLINRTHRFLRSASE
jgi:glycosyltransferase involved in cell wall biosynthesis